MAKTVEASSEGNSGAVDLDRFGHVVTRQRHNARGPEGLARGHAEDHRDSSDAAAVAAQLEQDVAASRCVDAGRLQAIPLRRRILGWVAAFLMSLANALFGRGPG